MNRQDFYSDRLRERYTRVIHPSGLTVCVFPKKLATFSAMLGVKYGSVDTRFICAGEKRERVTPAGVAHFLEHKLFANEDGSDSFDHFAALGADANAYTTFNKTVYLFHCTEHFPEALRELVRFVRHPYFTEKSVRAEQGIITQEIRMYEDNPYTACFFGMLRALYARHGIREDICGTVSSVKRIDADTLYACYDAFYRPSNMVLSVSGDTDVEEVMAVLEGVLPTTCRPHDTARGICAESTAVHRPCVSIQKKVEKPIFYIGIKDTDLPTTPRERAVREAAMTLLLEILFSRSGDFYNELLEEGLLAPGFSCGYSQGEDLAFHSLAGESERPEEVYRRIRAHMARAAERGIAEDELARAKRVLAAEFIRDFDSTEEIAGNLLNFSMDGFDIFEYLDIMEGIKAEELTALLRTHFADDAFAMATVSSHEARRFL